MAIAGAKVVLFLVRSAVSRISQEEIEKETDAALFEVNALADAETDDKCKCCSCTTVIVRTKYNSFFCFPPFRLQLASY